MNNFKYAPIAIPTLNRCEYLARCIESLERNTGANETEVYISVDYPSAEKYKNGYQEVLEYLSIKEKENSFKALHVFIQRKNLGPSENFNYLLDIIRKKHDTVITTEDDNEFSPNFLQYVNKGLSIFWNDHRVISINGCKEADWKADNSNVVALKMFPAYGAATWIYKRDTLIEECEKKLLSRDELKKCDFRKLRREDRTLFNNYILNVLLSDRMPFWKNEKLVAIDTVRSIYMHLSDKFSVVPMISTSRTWGNDGSGVNMQRINGLRPDERWPLDSEQDFDFVINGRAINGIYEYKPSEFVPLDVNNAIENSYMKSMRCLKANIHAEIGYIILRVFDFDRIKAKRIIGRFKHE